MSPNVASRPRHAFLLKSFLVGVVVVVGKVESSSTLPIIQIACYRPVPDNVLSVSICRGHDAYF